MSANDPDRTLGTQPVGRAQVTWNGRCIEFSTLNQPDKCEVTLTVAECNRARIRAVRVLRSLKLFSLMFQCDVTHANEDTRGRNLTAERKTKPYRSARGIEPKLQE